MAFVEATGVQWHLGYGQALLTFAVTLNKILPSLNVCHRLEVHFKHREIQVPGRVTGDEAEEKSEF